MQRESEEQPDPAEQSARLLGFEPLRGGDLFSRVNRKGCTNKRAEKRYRTFTNR